MLLQPQATAQISSESGPSEMQTHMHIDQQMGAVGKGRISEPGTRYYL